MASARQVGTAALPPYDAPQAGVIGLLLRTMRAPGALPVLAAGPRGSALLLDPRSTDTIGRVTCTLSAGTGVLWTLTYANPYPTVPMVRLVPEGAVLCQVQPVAFSVNGFSAHVLVGLAGNPTLTVGYEVIEFP